MKTNKDKNNQYSLSTIEHSHFAVCSVDNNQYYEHKSTLTYSIKTVHRAEVIEIKKKNYEKIF